MSDSMREKTLAAARNAVMQDRNREYSDPEDNFRTIAELWNAYWMAACAARGHVWAPIDPHDVAVFCDLIKTSRIATSPGLHDHWIDKAGYAACGAECAVEPPIASGTWGGDPAPARKSDAWTEAHAEWERQQRVGGR